VSSWRLELPQQFRQFDYNTISDVVLHVRYTARDGGMSFASVVAGQLKDLMAAMLVDAQNAGLYQGFDVRREFPDEWHLLRQNGTVPVTIRSDQLPFFTQAHGPQIQSVTWLAGVSGNPASYTMSIDGGSFTLSKDATLNNLFKGDSPAITFDHAFTLAAANSGVLDDLAVVIHYKLS
jgi:hypothetical protein